MSLSAIHNNLNLFSSLEEEIKQANAHYLKEVIRLSPKTLDEFTQVPITPLTNFHNVIVYKSQSLCFQGDFTGVDPDLCWPESSVELIEEVPQTLNAMYFDANRLHTNRSVTKSIISILLVHAIHNAKKNLTLESPIAEVLSEFKAYFPVRICDALNMAIPMDWDEQAIPYTHPDNPERLMMCAKDPYQHSIKEVINWLKNVDGLSSDKKKDIGKTARYNSCMTILCASMIERLTDKDLITYADEILFKPLGIKAHWRRLKNSKLASSSAGLKLSPNDMLKLGQFLLAEWQAHAQKDNPQDLISLVRKYAVKFEGKYNQQRYGLQFWVSDLQFAHRKEPISMLAMIGIGGNRISILPEEEMVCVMTGGNYTIEGIKNTFPTSAIFKDFIFKACELELLA